jgi:TonB family protein
MLRPVLNAILAAALLAGALSRAHATTEDAALPWPDTVVTIEQLRPLTPLQLKTPGIVVRGVVRGPATLRAHVNAAGEVARVGLLESCGNSDLDEAAMHAMRSMRFKPYTFGGDPTEVTLVVPLHVPKQLGRAH